ncbi:TonB-dependent receptor [Asticcacaulis sp. AND118]|uniref:TonB-dependent receptor n=1 Tax=Asticcacaulis sp. AND118 TaxID=2840468 RepID=UPI001CFFE819|nr:TonB-dependent receptor [Asticcacaulis sp. AND118]UDF04445.1 TonB-dependent receptor [Asticcacaulis sp. AND118]
MSKLMAAKSGPLLSTALGVLSLACAANAQTTETVADTEEVIVTAQRRSENIQRVPISVAALNGDAVRNLQTAGEDVLALSGRVPGLYAETTTGRIFPRFYIRGLGNVDFYLGASQPVSIIQDEVVLEHVVLKSTPVFDLQQVEVLRGPQGSLFGRNTTAGIIKFDTIKPSEDYKGRLSASYGTYGTTTLDAGIGGALFPGKLSFRLSALLQSRDHWVDNTYSGVSADSTQSPKTDAMGGYEDGNVRLQLLYTPTEDLSILASAHSRNYKGTSTLFRRNSLKKGSNDVAGEWDQVAYDEAQNNPQAYHTSGASVKVDYDFGGVKLTSISAYETANGYSRGDTDGGNVTQDTLAFYGQSMGKLNDLDQYTQELRLASDTDGNLSWQVGGYYFKSEDLTNFYQRAYFTGANPNNWVALRNKNTSSALFGQVAYKVTPALTITAGVRQTEDKKTTNLLKTADTAAGAVTYTGRRNVTLTGKEPSWDLSALYEVSPDVSLFARVARGFRGPTIQGRSAVFNADFTTADSETTTSYETGIKSRLFDRTLRLNASVFGYQVSDIQLNGNDSNGNGVLFNADKAEAYGLEAEAEWRPTANLTLTGGVSLLHSEIKDKKVYAQVCTLNTVPANPTNTVVCTVQDPTITVGRNTFAQIDGNPLPNAPEYTVNLGARYGIPYGVNGELFAATDWVFQGYTNFVLYKTAEFYSDNTFEGGLKLGYVNHKGGYEVALYGRNITNEKNLKGVIENYMAAVLNEPRVVGIAVSVKVQ